MTIHSQPQSVTVQPPSVASPKWLFWAVPKGGLAPPEGAQKGQEGLMREGPGCTKRQASNPSRNEAGHRNGSGLEGRG